MFEQAKRRCPGLGLVTVYRTVEKLEELGLIQRVHQPSGCHAFVAASTGHQHLLICEACGRVSFFSGDTLEGLIDEVGVRSGFHIQEHWLQLFGVCEDCQKQRLESRKWRLRVESREWRVGAESREWRVESGE